MDINEDEEQKIDVLDVSKENVAVQEIEMKSIQTFRGILPSSMTDIAEQAIGHSLEIGMDPFDNFIAKISPSISVNLTNVKMIHFCSFMQIK